MKLRRLTYILTVLLIAGCSSSKQIVQQTTPKQTQTPQKAVEHYLAGSLQDFQEHYKEALLEYYKALLYDSTSAQILKAIGRDLIRMQQNESAIEYLKRALKYNSEDKEIIYYLAEAYYNQKDKEKALQYFERFHALDPYNSMVHSNLIYLYSQLGKEEKLIALRKELAEASGYQSESAYQLLNLYVKLDRLIKARQLAQKMIDEEPDYYKNWAVYGNVLELDDDTTGAITAYKKALELEPNAEETLTDLYFLYARSGNWQALVETFGEIVAKDSTYDRARLLLAEGYFNLENYEKAQQTVQPLLKDSEFKQQAYLLSGRIAANENRLEDARANFKELTKIDPKNVQSWQFLAILYFQEQQYQKCLEVLQEALSIIPDDPRLLSLYGNTLQQMERYQDALEPLQKAHQLNPRDINTIVALGVIYEELSMFSKLDSLYEKALSDFPDNPLLLNNYSYSLSEREVKLEYAMEMAQNAIEQDPKNGAYLDTMGWIHFKLGNYQQALQYIQEAMSVREESAEVIEHLGDVHYKLGNLEEALKYWRQALDKDPENEALKAKVENHDVNSN